MRIHKIKFDDDKIPAWTYEGKEPSIYTFVETIALAGLEDKHIRLSAGLQRRLLGFPVLGKQEFRVGSNGELYVWTSACFGTDFNSTRMPVVYAGVAAKRGERIHAALSGRGIFSAYAYEQEFRSP